MAITQPYDEVYRQHLTLPMRIALSTRALGQMDSILVNALDLYLPEIKCLLYTLRPTGRLHLMQLDDFGKCNLSLVE